MWHPGSYNINEGTTQAKKEIVCTFASKAKGIYTALVLQIWEQSSKRRGQKREVSYLST